MTLAEAAGAVGVSAATLRRWVAAGVVPEYNGTWTSAAVSKARLVARIRERGYSLPEIRTATDEGRLAFGQLVELFDSWDSARTIRQAARHTGLEVGSVRRIAAALGVREGERLGEADVRLLRYVAAAVEAGLPLEAMVQLTRVYANSMAQIADAEVRLIHMYVHEPLMRSGGPPEEMSRELMMVVGDLLPLASPLLDNLHQRMLAQFIDQDIVGHMEAELATEGDDMGRVPVAIAFADLAGYTQFTEEAGEQHAVGAVERFIEAVTTTLPDDARVIKTIGDEVMVIGVDPASLARWAVEFAEAHSDDDPPPRLAVHHGYALYRDGDYYGREVNLAARVAAQSRAGEVLATRAIMDAVAGGIDFEHLEAVELKGFAEPTPIFRARRRGGS